MTLKPVHEEQVYAKQKTITDKEEAKLFAKVEKKVEAENKALEGKRDGKEKDAKTKNEDRAEHVRKGSDNGSKSANVS